MIERIFIDENQRKLEIEEYLAEEFGRADYSHCDIFKTPLGTRIIIHTNRPGLVIGRVGSRIKEITQTMQQKFKIEPLQLDVSEVSDPNLDPLIIAKQITSALERGMNHKKVINNTIKRIMSSGARGVQIVASGKFGSDRSRINKISEGYLKHSGMKDGVKEAYAVANTRPGTVGVKVMIVVDNRPKEIKVNEEDREIRTLE